MSHAKQPANVSRAFSQRRDHAISTQRATQLTEHGELRQRRTSRLAKEQAANAQH